MSKIEFYKNLKNELENENLIINIDLLKDYVNNLDIFPEIKEAVIYIKTTTMVSQQTKPKPEPFPFKPENKNKKDIFENIKRQLGHDSPYSDVPDCKQQ